LNNDGMPPVKQGSEEENCQNFAKMYPKTK